MTATMIWMHIGHRGWMEVYSGYSPAYVCAHLLRHWRNLFYTVYREAKEKEAAIVVLDMPLLDTRQGRDLTGTLIADIVLQLLSYVAQTEREFIRRRQAEGIAAAKAKGVHFGAKPLEKPAGYEECLQRWKRREISAREAAKRLNVSHPTFLKWTREI